MPFSDGRSFLDYVEPLLRCKKFDAAKKAAEDFVERFPEQPEGWLVLAALSEPTVSLELVKKAKEVAPFDSIVQKAEIWARGRLHQLDQTLPLKVAEIMPTTPESIPEPVVTEQRGIIWRWALIFILLSALFFFGMGILPRAADLMLPYRAMYSLGKDLKPTLTPIVETLSQVDFDEGIDPVQQATPSPSPSPSPTPTLVPDLYGCEMSITFVSGPLMGRGADFSMLDETYFEDKEGKFDPGKNTGLFYQEANHLILHSGYLGGNRNMPLEIEFLRFYLEEWADEQEPGLILAQIEQLLGSEMIWRCNGELALRLRINSIARLSHEASTRLWLEPWNIDDILAMREGIETEWIGRIEPLDKPMVFMNFCGWGPPWVAQDRSVYYRYLFQFEIIKSS